MPIMLHEILQAAAAILDRGLAQIGACERQQVEGDHDSLAAPGGTQQAVEVTVAVRPKDHGLAVERQQISGQRGCRPGKEGGGG